MAPLIASPWANNSKSIIFPMFNDGDQTGTFTTTISCVNTNSFTVVFFIRNPVNLSLFYCQLFY